MCLAPNKVPNPYRGYRGAFWYLHDTESLYMYVPCGTCKECIALKQMYLVQRVQMEARNSLLFFSTLTYNNDWLPQYDCGNGKFVRYADIKHLQDMFKRLRSKNAFGRPFRYLAVSERGGHFGRPHFHILWFLPKYDKEDYLDGYSLQNMMWDTIMNEWRINVSGNKRNPEYVPLFTYHECYRGNKLRRNYDTHFVLPSLTDEGVSSVAFYVCKYMLKGSSTERSLQQALRLNYDDEEYKRIYQQVKSRTLRSEHFGLDWTDTHCSYDIVKYLRDGIKFSKGCSPYALFLNPDSGSTFPLAPYYKRFGHIYTMNDHLSFKMEDDSVFVDFNKSTTQVENGYREYERISQLIDFKDISIDLESDFYDF